MLREFIVVMVVLNVALCKPQFITFKDGKIGVNFGGYYASAGLGGILTGNPEHGGLSASAGTPYGQHAGAGIGMGQDDQGRAVPGLYAGATAGNGLGAGAGIGGNGMIFAGASKPHHSEPEPPRVYLEKRIEETPNTVIQHIATKDNEIIREKRFILFRKSFIVPSTVETTHHTTESIHPPPPPPTTPHPAPHNTVSQTPIFTKQFFKPWSFTYTPVQVQPVNYTYTYTPITVRKTINPSLLQIKTRIQVEDVNTNRNENILPPQPSPAAGVGATVHTSVSSPTSSIIDSIFNIPIATLTAVNNFLRTKAAQPPPATYTVQKSVNVSG